MKSSVKKILTIICSLFLSVAMLVGCNLTELNKYKYYNQVVIYVGDDVEYTKKDLLDAFYSYAYSNVQSGSMDTEEGVNYAAKTLVERGLIIDYVKSTFFGTDKPLQITEQDQKDIRLSAFDYMQEQIDDYEVTIRDERGLTVESEDTTEESTDTLRDAFKSYTPTVIYNSVSNKVFYNPDAEESSSSNSDALVVPEHFTQRITDESVSTEAMTRYVKSLQDAAKAEGKKDTSKSKVLLDEENRLIDAYTDNKYLEKYQTYYEKTSNFDATTKELVDTQSVIDEFVNTYNDQKAKYSDPVSGLSDYYADMKSDSTSVFYHPVEGKFMYVYHILLKFSDAQTAEIKNYAYKLDNGQISQETYDKKVKDIASKTVVTYEENGKTYTTTPSVVYTRVSQYISTSSDPVEKAQLFNDMIYKYNDDDGMMNRDFPYVVNLDNGMTNDYGDYNSTNIMVDKFTDAARELYENDYTTQYGAGNLSGQVISEYGIHIIFNAGAVTNYVNDSSNVTVSTLFGKYTSLNHYKTLFNYFYDKVTTSSYSSTMTDLVNTLESNLKIVYMKKYYKDLYK